MLRVDQADQSHDFQTLYANPAEEQGAIWILVASAGTMSHFTDYVTSRDLAVLAINFGAGAGSFAATSSGPYDYKSSVIHELEIRFRDAAGTTNRDLTDL